MKIFGKKSETKTKGITWGCISPREKEFVVLAGQIINGFSISKLSRKASLETLRLQGIIKTVASGYNARTLRVEELQYQGLLDRVKIGADFIQNLKQKQVNLKEKTADFTVDENGTVNGTTTKQKDVEEAMLSVEGFRGRTDESCRLIVETRGRAALRYYLSKYIPEPEQDVEEATASFENNGSSDNDEETALTVCLAIVEENGYSTVIWNGARGLFWEVEQPFSTKENDTNWTTVGDCIRRLLNNTSLESLKISKIDRIAVVAADDCKKFLTEDLEDENIYFEDVTFNQGLDYHLTAGSQDLTINNIEGIVTVGLLLEDSRVPSINLNRDLVNEINIKEQERVQFTQKRAAATNRNLTLLLLAPVITVLVCCGIFYLSLYKQESNLDARQEKAKTEESQLSAVTQELQNIKTSSDQVQNIGTQIGVLRNRQPANFLLLMALNRKWPAGGAAWQIDEITSKQDGTVTIKGKTASDESLTEFAKNLDFSDDFDAVKVSKGDAGNGPTPAAYEIPGTAAGGSGIIKFVVEARYKPLMSGPPAAPTTAANGPPPAAPTGPGPTPAVTPQVATGTLPKPPNS